MCKNIARKIPDYLDELEPSPPLVLEQVCWSIGSMSGRRARYLCSRCIWNCTTIRFNSFAYFGTHPLHNGDIVEIKDRRGWFLPALPFLDRRNILGAAALAESLADKKIFIASTLPLYLEVELHCISFLKIALNKYTLQSTC